jgi:hypothetical protein
MTPAPKRWFRWSLRTFFVVLTVPGAWFGWQLHQVKERDRQIQSRDFLRLLEYPERKNVTERWVRKGHDLQKIELDAPKPRKEMPYVWSLLGAERLEMDIQLPDDKYTTSDMRRIQSLYPECYVSLIPASRDSRRFPKPSEP